MRVLPDSIEIISYNGVDPSIKQKDFDKGVIRARRYRNRRIGEFLKELRLTEGRGTGIPTIIKSLKNNGSGKPSFDTDDPDRRHFVMELLIHHSFAKITENEGGAIGGAIELTDRQNEVLDLIKENDRIGYREVAEKLGINNSAAQSHFDALKESNRKSRRYKRVLEDKGKWMMKCELLLQNS